MIQEKMRASQSRQKSYHDKRRKDIELKEGDHVFMRVTPMTSIGRALKSKKLTPRFIGPFQITKKIGKVAYQIALPPALANLHDVFHVSQLRKYIADPSHEIQVDDIQVRDNLTVETLPMRIEDRKVKCWSKAASNKRFGNIYPGIIVSTKIGEKNCRSTISRSKFHDLGAER